MTRRILQRRVLLERVFTVQPYDVSKVWGWNMRRSTRTFSSGLPEQTPDQARSDHNYCVEMVQNRDREGYLCGLLMPTDSQKAYFALRAFNVELASIKDGGERRRASHSEEAGSTLAQRMRMEWWRDSLLQIYSAVDESKESDVDKVGPEPSVEGFLNSSYTSCWNNPVVRALGNAVQEKQLTKRFLERMLDARLADLDIQQLRTMEDAIFYAEDSSANLLYLSLECVGVRDEVADEAASNIGIGWGIITSIRSTLFRARTGEMALPFETLAEPVSTDYLLARMSPDFRPNPGRETIIKEAVQYMAYQASVHLNNGRKLRDQVPKNGRTCLLPAVPAQHYLTKLQECEFNLWDERLQSDQRLLLLAMLARSWMSGRY